MQKTVLITGGNSGIGKATAKQLAQQSWNVIIATRSSDKAQQAI
ncbi:MAG TPA: SDR family NAD(P)-dependent oxidoreductase, partial [Chitinophagales bacterium]|nr:SDR family NAD(P)-dependent oxidoreductase [Chitinophagales bacterium]